MSGVCRQLRRSIPACGAVPAWGMVQNSMGCGFPGNRDLHFPTWCAGFLTCAVKNCSYAAGKQTARTEPCKETVNGFAGNRPALSQAVGGHALS